MWGANQQKTDRIINKCWCLLLNCFACSFFSLLRLWSQLMIFNFGWNNNAQVQGRLYTIGSDKWDWNHIPINSQALGLWPVDVVGPVLSKPCFEGHIPFTAPHRWSETVMAGLMLGHHQLCQHIGTLILSEHPLWCLTFPYCANSASLML